MTLFFFGSIMKTRIEGCHVAFKKVDIKSRTFQECFLQKKNIWTVEFNLQEIIPRIM